MEKRDHFSGKLGFILAAAGSAVGLGNIWRFPYLAAKDGGGIFLLCYLILTLTFGYTLLTTEIAIGRKTQQSSTNAFGILHPKSKWIGYISTIIPALILPYYCVIGGWVLKYMTTYVTGQGAQTVINGYFDSFIAHPYMPMIYFVIYLFLTFIVVYKGVGKGIEKLSKTLMPFLILLIICISLYSLTLSHTNAEGITRSGIEGFLIYVIPNFEGMTLSKFLTVLMDAAGQLFYSISVAMGIMVTYGSYMKKDIDLCQSVTQIEFFDTFVAFLAGLMIIPAVYTFVGVEGMNAGPGLMFVSLPNVFLQMGSFGFIIGAVFFTVVLFAAVTSSVSVMEAVVSNIMDTFQLSRSKSTIYVFIFTFILGIVVCLGYNHLFFDIVLPNGTHAQILDVLDYISNFILMPVVSIATCLLIGWIIKPKVIEEEITSSGHVFKRKQLYLVMLKYIVPALLFFLLLQALGIISI